MLIKLKLSRIATITIKSSQKVLCSLYRLFRALAEHHKPYQEVKFHISQGLRAILAFK